MIIHVAPQASIATTPNPSPSVANEGFAPLCGAAAISMAALKTPVASKRRGATKGKILKFLIKNGDEVK